MSDEQNDIIKMEKSCDNCYWLFNGCAVLDGCSSDACGYQPDYPTLERENAELTQALERACEMIDEITVDGYGCDVCSAREWDCGKKCKQTLVEHFKEATQ